MKYIPKIYLVFQKEPRHLFGKPKQVASGFYRESFTLRQVLDMIGVEGKPYLEKWELPVDKSLVEIGLKHDDVVVIKQA